MSERFQLNRAELGYACSPLVNIGEGMSFTYKQIMDLRRDMSGERSASLSGWLKSQEDFGNITEDNREHLVFGLNSYRNIDGQQFYLLERGVDMREAKGAMQVITSALDSITYIDELREKAEEQALGMAFKRMEAFASGIPAALESMKQDFHPTANNNVFSEMGFAATGMFEEAVRSELQMDPHSGEFWAIMDETDIPQGSGADYLTEGLTIGQMLDMLREEMKRQEGLKEGQGQGEGQGIAPSMKPAPRKQGNDRGISI